jgi:hypothetical protein
MPTRLVFDSEADNFLYAATKVHCICAKDLDTNLSWKFPPDKVQEGLELLSSYDIICGHNICGYDIPLFKKLYPNFHYKELRDSLCMSKLFDPERPLHGLESYGAQFGRPKPVHEDWTAFTPEMLHRCSEDVEINYLTYKYLVDKHCRGWSWKKALEIEQEFVLYRAAQELEGIDIDVELAREVINKLDQELLELDSILTERIPGKMKKVGVEHGYLPFKKNGEYNSTTLKWFVDHA